MQALEWLHICRTTHPQACEPQKPSFRPTRLLDLGNPDTQIKLVKFDSNSNGPDLIMYACLSHCWGGIEPRCLTTRKTLNDNRSGIAWSDIPRTFQDAIVFTRGLGIQYLWIDSLCIIQPEKDGELDEEDWLQQGAMMADIYSNSSITIAATCASNCNEGLRRPGQPEGHYCNWIMHAGWPADDRPLIRRAWYFQEQYLSPSVLHFYYDRLVWKCRCAMACSCNGLLDLECTSAFAQCEDMTDNQLRSHWPRIVCAYSACHLTKDSDRLAAITGVAKASGYLQRNFKYVAGLWMKDSGIPLSLDWRTRGLLVERRHKPDEWAAPSWSWASTIPPPIDWSATDDWPSTEYPDATPGFKIINYELTPKNPDDGDKIGPLKQEGASITINGSAVRGTLLYDDSRLDVNNPCKYEVALCDDKPIRGIFYADFTVCDKSQQGHVRPGSPVVLFWLFTLPCTPKASSQNPIHKPSAVFLVLSQKAHTTIGTTEFERIARFDVPLDEFIKNVEGLLVKESTFRLV